jgi:hypothetical protein
MAPIGKGDRIGPIGKSSKRVGGLGKTRSDYGSSTIMDKNDIKSEYPTTTT